MDLPFFSNQEVWRQLCSDQIGFYTKKTSGNVPDQPGLYAWYYPFKVTDEIADDIQSIKNVFNFDPISHLHSHREHTSFVQWQAVTWSVRLSDQFQSSETMDSNWHALMEACNRKQRQAMSQILLLGSILSRPLYVGLTLTSLSARYDQHINGTRKNSFFRRFTDHMSEIGSNTSVNDLIFVALPLDFAQDLSLSDCHRDQFIKSAEYFLKNVLNPVYGER